MGTDRFYSKQLTDEQKDRIDTIRKNFTQLYDYLDSEIPAGREKSLYATKMEEACMWAIKAVSIEPVNFEEFVKPTPYEDFTPTSEQIMEQMNKINEKLKKEIY